jgi:outer membrane protein assembly complex protein YaeT
VAVAVGAVLFAWAGPAGALDLVEQGLPRVRRVRIEGEHVLKEADIKKVLKTQGRRRLAFWARGAYFRQDFLNSDLVILRELAAQRGFLEATATARTVADSVRNELDVVFSLAEGPRTYVRGIEVSPTATFTRPALLAKLSTKVGEPFNPQRLGLDRQILGDAYADVGRFPVISASWTRIDPAGVSVVFQIDEGPEYRVGEMAVEGLTAVDTPVVMRELLLKPGKRFERRALLKSSERLYETNLFQLVDFAPARIDTAAAVVDLRLRLRERNHRWVEAGVGAGSADGLRIGAQGGHGNLGGRGRSADVTTRYTFGKLQRFANRVRYDEPWLFHTRMQGEAGAYFEQQDQLFREAQFTQRLWGFYFSVKRRLSPFTEGTLGFDNQWSMPRTVPDADLTGFIREQIFTQRLSLLLQYDRRDDPLDPRKGEYYEVAGQTAGHLLGGQSQFSKATVTGAWHRLVDGRASVALRMQVGGIWAFGSPGSSPLGNVPLQDLYRTGGAYSVRGYPDAGIVGADGTGGVMLLVTNAELRFPVVGALGGALFVDGGNVWARARDFKLGQLGLGGGPAGGNDYRWSLGTGLRLQTPVGPFRFDVAARLRDQIKPGGGIAQAGLGYDLSIGQPF